MGSAEHPALWTIGHSRHPIERFVGLLRAARIDAVIDVRTSPFSRFSPQFVRDRLAASLEKEGIAYVFLGKELGGRPADGRFYDAAGHVLYSKLAKSEIFRHGIERLERELARRRCAILCSEEDPAECHRHLLIGRVLHRRGVETLNIRKDGRVETFEEVEGSLGKAASADLFATRSDTWRSPKGVSPAGPPTPKRTTGKPRST